MHQHEDDSDDVDQEIESLMEELDELQCDDSTNFEICHLVAEFFSVLEGNEKHDEFKIHYDDLPIYYIPAKHKDRLYLMANLFTKVSYETYCQNYSYTTNKNVSDTLYYPLTFTILLSSTMWQTNLHFLYF